MDDKPRGWWLVDHAAPWALAGWLLGRELDLPLLGVVGLIVALPALWGLVLAVAGRRDFPLDLGPWLGLLIVSLVTVGYDGGVGEFLGWMVAILVFGIVVAGVWTRFADADRRQDRHA